ncbi:hypothetical protein LCGC14_1745630 [marine sediment metagenome]|uniref:Uncharacterized protein n=1 Tax=marine sediment metagenome TaxID=412755 RepID=A0A0F9H5G3_9ZZZZ
MNEWKFGMNLGSYAVYTKGTRRRIYDEDKLLLEYDPVLYPGEEKTLGDVLIETTKEVK